MLARPAQRAHLALDTAHPEAAGDHDGVDARQSALGPLSGLAAVRCDPADIDARIIGEAAVANGLRDRQVRIVQVDVLAHQRDLDAVARIMHTIEQPIPLGPIHIPEGQGEALDEEGVESLAVQDRRHLVDAGGILALDNGGGLDIAHESDLALEALGQGPVGAQHERIGLNADRTQRRHRMLGGLGLELTGCGQEGNERDVHEGDVLPPQVGAHLAGGLEEGLRLDVPHRAADLGDDDIGRRAVGIRSGLRPHDPFDLVGDVRDDLNRVSEILAAALLGDHGGVDLPGGGIGGTGEIDVQKALVVTDVQIGLRAVLSNEDLTVLKGIHRAGVDVDVRIQLLHHDAEPASPQKTAQAGCCEPLPKRGDDAPGDEDVPRTVGQGSTQACAV